MTIKIACVWIKKNNYELAVDDSFNKNKLIDYIMSPMLDN